MHKSQLLFYTFSALYAFCVWYLTCKYNEIVRYLRINDVFTYELLQSPPTMPPQSWRDFAFGLNPYRPFTAYLLLRKAHKNQNDAQFSNTICKFRVVFLLALALLVGIIMTH
jgi:hypothetical protein